MPERTVELTTTLTVAQCAEQFKLGIDQGRGIGSQIGGMVNKLRGATDLDYYTPEPDAFSAANEYPPAFEVGVAIPRLNKQHAYGTNVHMAVWDRETHRDVLLWAHYATFGVAHAVGVLQKVQEALGGTAAGSASGSPPPPTAAHATVHASANPPPPSGRPTFADGPPATPPAAGVGAGPAPHDSPSATTPSHEAGPAIDEDGLTEVGRAALSYAHRCRTVVDAMEATLEHANRACSARRAAAQRPQHEISINNFNQLAAESEREFVPLYKGFLQACAEARDSAVLLRQLCAEHEPPLDPELALLVATDEKTYPPTGTAFHILRTEYGSTPAGFIAGIEVSNEAIQGDIFNYGEDGFQGQVWAPPGTDDDVRLPGQWPPATRPTVAVHPSSWGEIHSELLKFAASAPESIKLLLADPHFVAFTISEDGGARSQNVTVIHADDASGTPWLRIESGLAQYSVEAALAALDYVAEPRHSMVGVTKYSNDYLALRWAARIGTVSLSEVFAMIDFVAGMTDELEAKVSSGIDRF